MKLKVSAETYGILFYYKAVQVWAKELKKYTDINYQGIWLNLGNVDIDNPDPRYPDII